mgnify:CR=1 FL=1
MGKIAFVFPGQGAQKVGMGKEFYETSPIAKEIFDKASEAVELDLKALCFEENDDINITEYTQVALLTTSVAIMEVLKDRGIKPDVAAGLSLGEYCALVAANSMNYIDAAKAVRKRGIYMQEEVPAGEGAMAAILALDAAVIEEVTAAELNERCQHKLVFTVDDVQKAAAIFTETIPAEQIRIAGNQVILSSHLEEAAELNKRLVQQNVAVNSFWVHAEGLEQYFMKRIGG